MMKKILFISTFDAQNDRKGWSGIPFHIYKQLCKYYEVSLLKTRTSVPLWIKVREHMRTTLIGGTKIGTHTIAYSKRVGKEIMRHRLETYDCIFILGDALCAYLETSVPIVYYTDAVFSRMINYYWFHLTKKGIKEGSTLQKLALQKANVVVFASEWAKNGAEIDYGINREKAEVIHLGSGVNGKSNIPAYSPNEINILFCGVDWKRKGGGISCEVLRELQEIDKDHKYILHLVGGRPETEISNPNIHIHGFLDRNNQKEREALERIWEETDVLLLPTKAECAGIVFAEAASQGIPSISYNTGGVSDYIEQNITGILLPQEASAREFAIEISSLIKDEARMELMKKSAKEKYENDLNWTVFGEKIKHIIDVL